MSYMWRKHYSSSIEIQKEDSIYAPSKIFAIESSLSKVKKTFNGHQENDDAPIPLNDFQIHEKVNKIHHVFGKTPKKSCTTSPWKKKSIFFDLSYWRIWHCIDVIHVEKNVCDSLIGTLLNIQGKTKDGVNARFDMLEMDIRKDLAPREVGKRTYLPPACYTMSR